MEAAFLLDKFIFLLFFLIIYNTSMLKILYKGEDAGRVKKDIQKAFDFVAKIFPVKISNITVCVHNTRASYGKKLNKETEDWNIANANDNNRIDILSPEALLKESCHPKSDFLPTLTHEFSHLFAFRLAKGGAIPLWLNEGLSEYLAKQDQKVQGVLYIENNFCEKLGTMKGWDKYINYSAYQISALFVLFLIKKYSIEKIKELISSLDKVYYYPRFEKIFFKVYGKDLNETEKLFIDSINKNK